MNLTTCSNEKNKVRGRAYVQARSPVMNRPHASRKVRSERTAHIAHILLCCMHASSSHCGAGAGGDGVFSAPDAMQIKALHMVQHQCGAARRPARRLRQVALRDAQQCLSMHFTAHMAESSRHVSLEQDSLWRVSLLFASSVHVFWISLAHRSACQRSHMQVQTSTSSQALQSVATVRTAPFAPCKTYTKAVSADICTQLKRALTRDIPKPAVLARQAAR